MLSRLRDDMPMRFSALLLATLPLLAQNPFASSAIVSPEVHSDRRVTFRFRAPNAKEVFVSREGQPRLPMTKDDKGVWSVTTDPMEADIYGYSFIADGVGLVDPSNARMMKTNLLNLSNMVVVPGSPSNVWEEAAVPRGTVHKHYYRSGVVGDDRDFHVYTPPGYDPAAKTTYPVLYLLHGYSDDSSGWTQVGRAHVIFDNLLAQGKMKPMIVVMTLGYGDLRVLDRTGGAFRTPGLFQSNYEKYRDALFTEVIPMVEKSYRAKTDRESRAIAGLSMGGAESLFVGLNAMERFAWVGAFSTGGADPDLAKSYPKLDASANKRMRLIWVGCGTEDRLIDWHRKFVEHLKSKEVKATTVETSGAHTWLVWRRYLAQFAPLLFQKAS